MDQQSSTASQFGANAQRYLKSAIHAVGIDLDQLTEFVRSAQVSETLDLGCGAGHASFALARGGAQRVVAYDLAQPMLDVVSAQGRARGHHQLETCRGSVEHLPFAPASFDLAVTRYSAHHWLDVQRGIDEVARVVKPGGTFILIDVLAPESPLLDTALQTVELLRDPSHVRNYRASEWRRVLAAAGFAERQARVWKLAMEFEAWVARIGTTPPRIEALRVVLDELPREACDYFQVRADRSFTIDAGWFELRR